MTRFSILMILTTLVTAPAFAQKTVEAQEIIDQINQGKAVYYEKVTVRGTLDLTDLDNKEKSGSNWGFFSSNDTYESEVEQPITFIHCVFQDDVLAYHHNDRSDDTFVANFAGNAIFQDCVFEQASEFKYSEFSEEAVFQSCVFQEDANFKYAEFAEAPNFGQVVFESDANFKYAEFPENTNFAEAIFKSEANFKYADFPGGAVFENTIFVGLANFKYSKFSTPLNMNNVAFNGSEDFKYTEVDGEDFTGYLLHRK